MSQSLNRNKRDPANSGSDSGYPTADLSLPLYYRYIQAATSPKDIVIVVDTSGSMKGLRMTIAKHTVSTILDTLGENDFVNIIAVNTPPVREKPSSTCTRVTCTYGLCPLELGPPTQDGLPGVHSF